MKIKFILILLTSYSLIACGQSNNQAKTTTKAILTQSNLTTMQEENILKPVKALIEAMEAEDAKKIREQFAKTATQAYGADGQMKSAAETAKWLESDIISRKGKLKNPEYSVISENDVVVKGQYASIGYTNKANFLFTVENGLITSWRMRY